VADAAREHRRGLKVLFITGYGENAATANGFLAPGMENGHETLRGRRIGGMTPLSFTHP